MGSVYALRVVRPAGGGKFTAVGTSNSFTRPTSLTRSTGRSRRQSPIEGRCDRDRDRKQRDSDVLARGQHLHGVRSAPGRPRRQRAGARSPQNNAGSQVAVQATITFTTPAAGLPAELPPPPPGAGKASLSAFSLSAKTFRAASRGASVARTRRRVFRSGRRSPTRCPRPPLRPSPSSARRPAARESQVRCAEAEQPHEAALHALREGERQLQPGERHRGEQHQVHRPAARPKLPVAATG